MKPSRSRALSVFVAIAATAALAAGCGGDDDDSDASDASASAPVDKAEADEGDAGAGETVEVIGVDYAYEELPASVAAGTTLSLHNDSDTELHEIVAFLLPDDETRSAEELAQLPEEEQGQLFSGEPAMVLLAPPGEDSFAAVGDGTVTEPGRYVVFCAIPEGADPDAYLNAPPSDGPPQVDGGPPHFTLGMLGEFTVE